MSILFIGSILIRVASYVCNEQTQKSEQSMKPADSLTRYLREAEANLLKTWKPQRPPSSPFITSEA